MEDKDLRFDEPFRLVSYCEEDLIDSDAQQQIELEFDEQKKLGAFVPEAPQTPQERRRERRTRAAAEAALRRLEESARTKADFKKVIKEWNALDANRMRRENYHEILRGDVPIDYGCSNTYDALIFPGSINTPMEKQIRAGYYLDYIANCPFEMHDLTASKYLTDIVKGLKDEHKEILYCLAIQNMDPKELAEMRGQSVRNIRRARAVVYNKLHNLAYAELMRKMANGYRPTCREKKFIRRYENGMKDVEDDK